MPGPKPEPSTDKPLDPEIARDLSDPAEKTEENSGEQERARPQAESPTEPGVTTEQQPT